MKMRKLLALAMALTLAATPMTAYAEDTTSGGTVPGTGADLTVQGDVNYANTTVYQVTLPTSSGLAFALDPQGLSTLTGGQVGSGSEGKIVSSAPWVFNNKSSVEVTITGEFYVTDSEDATKPLTLLAKDATLDDKSKAMCMILQEQVGTGTYTYTDLGVITSKDSSAKSSISFNLGGAAYEFKESSGKYTYELKSGEEGVTKNIVIGGTVASEYDWSAYTKDSSPETLKLNAVFSFAKKATDLVMTAAGDGSISYTFEADAPTGTLTALRINDSGRQGFVDGGYATYANNKFMIASSKVTAVMATTGTYNIVATIGGTEYNFKYVVE